MTRLVSRLTSDDNLFSFDLLLTESMVVSSSKMAELANELLKTIRATQELRSNVSHVFERLGDGAQGKEHVFLSELQRNLLSVNTALE